jgi:hypothetical protein
VRSAFFWDITQRRVVILYRCFGTTYQSHLYKGQEIQEFLDLWKDGTDRFSRNVGKELPDFLTLEYEADRLSRNVGKGLPLDAA